MVKVTGLNGGGIFFYLIILKKVKQIGRNVRVFRGTSGKGKEQKQDCEGSDHHSNQSGKMQAEADFRFELHAEDTNIEVYDFFPRIDRMHPTVGPKTYYPTWKLARLDLSCSGNV